jgi:predicted metal-dependent HD superfamily phosphohydrolase
VALVDAGLMKLKQHEFGEDDAVILDECPCQACSRKISRKRLHGLLKSNNNTVAIQLVTQHNVTYMMGLVTRMRKAILNKSYPDFCRKFIDAQFPNPQDVPAWVTDALNAAGISLTATKEDTVTVTAEELGGNSSFDPAATLGLRSHLKRKWDASFQGLVDNPTSKSKCDEWFEKIFQQYNESGRFYHTGVHLKEMLDYWALLMQQDDSLSPWSNVISWATFFHDAIYDPRSSQNEKDSAKLFQQFWKEAFCIDIEKASAPDTDTTRLAKLVVMLIHATEKHEIITDPTMTDREVELQKVFLDVDMAVIGKKKEAYLTYAGLIRKEYAFVDRPVYCEKRAKILTGFLQNKKQIFLSDFFHNALEQQARNNLKDEIDLLQRGAIPGDEHGPI